MDEEIKNELKSFLSSISPEELKDLVNKYDSEFERGNGNERDHYRERERERF